MTSSLDLKRQNPGEKSGQPQGDFFGGGEGGWKESLLRYGEIFSCGGTLGNLKIFRALSKAKLWAGLWKKR